MMLLSLMLKAFVLLTFVLFAVLGASLAPNDFYSMINNTTTSTTAAAATRLFSVVGGLEAFPLHQALVVETIMETIMEGLPHYTTTQVETPLSLSLLLSLLWQGFSGLAVSHLLLVSPLLAPTCLVASLLPLWRLVLVLVAFQCLLALVSYALTLICCSVLFASQLLWLMLALLAPAVATSLPMWSPERPLVFFVLVALLVVALWTFSLLWMLVEVLVLVAFQCLLACYALPLIHHSALFAPWPLWLTLALLALTVATLLPLWRPELLSLFFTLVAV